MHLMFKKSLRPRLHRMDVKSLFCSNMTKFTVTWLKIVTFLTAYLVECFASQPRTVQAFVGDNVLLPCNCETDVERVVWQTRKNDQTIAVVNTYDPNSTDEVDVQFTNRTQFAKEPENCSLLLFGVTVADQGVYDCHTMSPLHTKKINLTVEANYSSPGCVLKPSDEEVTYHCTASGGYPEGKIYWKLDNQSTFKPTFRSQMDTSSKLYNLSGNLTVNKTRIVQCIVEKPGQIITANCIHSEPFTKEKVNSVAIGIPVILTLMMALSVLVVYVYCRKWKTTVSGEPLDRTKGIKDKSMEGSESMVLTSETDVTLPS